MTTTITVSDKQIVVITGDDVATYDRTLHKVTIDADGVHVSPLKPEMTTLRVVLDEYAKSGFFATALNLARTVVFGHLSLEKFQEKMNEFLDMLQGDSPYAQIYDRLIQKFYPDSSPEHRRVVMNYACRIVRENLNSMMEIPCCIPDSLRKELIDNIPK